MSQTLTSCESGNSSAKFTLQIHAASGTLYSLFLSLNGPAGACIPVASVSPINVYPVHVLKHCGAHQRIIYNTHEIQNNLRTHQLPASWV